MHTEHNTMNIEINDSLMRKVVYAISKAVTQDLPQDRRENHKETNNRYRSAVGDYINDNLRNLVVEDGVSLLPFNRGGWEGRILTDDVGRITYTIMRSKTLRRAMRVKRNAPYYQQSILFIENGDCEGCKQMSLFGEDSSVFSPEEYAEDFDRIFQGVIDKTAGYRHYIVTYETLSNEITDIQLLFLDKDFAEVDSKSLKEYLTPDFAALTSNSTEDNASSNDKDHNHHKEGLLKVRPGVKPVLRVDEMEA